MGNARNCFVPLHEVAVKQILVIDGYVKRVLIYGKYLSLSVEDRTPYGIQRIRGNPAGFRNAFVFIRFHDLKLKEPGGYTGKKHDEDDEDNFKTKRIHGLFTLD